MFELQCADDVKELWHDICRAVIIERLPNISKVHMYYTVFKPGRCASAKGWCMPGFLKLLLSVKCVCVCVLSRDY